MPPKLQATVPTSPGFGSLDRVVYPAAGFTKADVVRYYRSVALYLLPHLRGRPVTLKRYPDVVETEVFYEKDAPAFTPNWVKRFPVWRRSGESQIHYIVINDVLTLTWAAMVGTIEIHPFLHRLPDPDCPNLHRFRSRSRRRRRAICLGETSAES